MSHRCRYILLFMLVATVIWLLIAIPTAGMLEPTLEDLNIESGSEAAQAFYRARVQGDTVFLVATGVYGLLMVFLFCGLVVQATDSWSESKRTRDVLECNPGRDWKELNQRLSRLRPPFQSSLRSLGVVLLAFVFLTFFTGRPLLSAGAVLIFIFFRRVLRSVAKQRRAAREDEQRPPFQFSLRTLLAVVFLANVFFAALVCVRAYLKAGPVLDTSQEKALRAIDKLYGHVCFSHELAETHSGVTLSGNRIGGYHNPGDPPLQAFGNQMSVGRWVRDFRVYVVEVGSFAPGFGDAEMASLRDLPTVESLDLTGTGITDAGLKHLAGLTNLQVLNLRGTQVTDQGVKKLQEALPNCKIITDLRR